MAANPVKEVVELAKEKTEPVVIKARTAAASAAKRAEPMLDAVKTAGKQLAEGYVPEFYVQFDNRQYNCEDLLERCREDFRQKHKNIGIRSCKLYIKPEDNMVYYVINDIEDKLPL